MSTFYDSKEREFQSSARMKGVKKTGQEEGKKKGKGKKCKMSKQKW